MRVACVQMCSGAEVAVNLDAAATLLAEAAGQGARLALLPENFSFMSPDSSLKRGIAEEVGPAVVLPFLAEMARRHALYVVGGSLLLAGKEGKLRNACPVFAPDGSCLAVYDKIHLFDVDLPNESHRESELIEPGVEPRAVDIEGWLLGLSICYDLRFPELYRRYARDGCQLLSVPSAFTVPTGQAHWEILLRARAIENQAYVLAPAQGGIHPGGRRTWGHTLIIDPWGTVLAELREAPAGQGGVVLADLDAQRLWEVRGRLPALGHRRLD
ncbi:carbon-nitrogen hydrolase family protein [Geoalkalibacter sp.]|uniref:carbon-nitrogen hydrolase family protein n=1 Tax=Geoalkalibacter sp. TaxID=3041440 RepID=UPI00272EC841|nr:carbon-nitrogen hydrolase family protein [Geoalkalibacter sp.]